jgi:hypothetical protein
MRRFGCWCLLLCCLKNCAQNCYSDESLH